MLRRWLFCRRPCADSEPRAPSPQTCLYLRLSPNFHFHSQAHQILLIPAEIWVRDRQQPVTRNLKLIKKAWVRQVMTAGWILMRLSQLYVLSFFTLSQHGTFIFYLTSYRPSYCIPLLSHVSLLWARSVLMFTSFIVLLSFYFCCTLCTIM